MPYATPERHLIKESSAIYKKAWVAVPVARPTLQGVSHCLPVKDEQRRSPRRICVQSIPLYPCLRTDTNEDYMNTYPNGHLSLLCHLTGIQVCETLKSQKNKASDKRLFLYVIPPLRFCLSDCFKVRMWQIYNLSLNKENGLVFFFKEMSGFLAFYECPAHARLSTLKRTRQARQWPRHRTAWWLPW